MAERALVTDSAGEFDDALADGGVLLALDLGTRTIGIATCDAGWRFATAGKTIARGKFGKDSGKLREIVEARKVAGIVIGLPRNMDGSEGPRAQSTRAFANNMAGKTDLPITFWDERLTTAEADRVLIDQADMNRKRRGEVIDKMAASIILQNFLDFLRNSG